MSIVTCMSRRRKIVQCQNEFPFGGKLFRNKNLNVEDPAYDTATKRDTWMNTTDGVDRVKAEALKYGYQGALCMDIEYKTPNVKFSLRSAALIFHNNYVLFAKSDNYDCFYTVGGTVSENVTTKNAVLRECYE